MRSQQCGVDLEHEASVWFQYSGDLHQSFPVRGDKRERRATRHNMVEEIVGKEAQIAGISEETIADGLFLSQRESARAKYPHRRLSHL